MKDRTLFPRRLHGAVLVAALLSVLAGCAATGAPAATATTPASVPAPAVTAAGEGVSPAFTVSGAVARRATFDLAALKALPAITETVGGTTYVGVSLWDLLNTTTGIVTDPAVKNDVLDKFVVATGSDGYKALISMGEIDPAFGDQPDLVAYEADGTLLDTNGFARLVVPGDVKAGRYVSNLINLQVFSAAPVPEPASVALLLAGVASLGAFARVTRRAR